MNSNKKLNPIKWVPSVYFAMGLPYVIVAIVSTLMFNDMGISETQNAFWTSLILLPWALKPLWSPFMEIYKTKKFYVVTTQMISGIGFGLVALSLPLPNFFQYAIGILAVVAFSGATHDIATDGIYMSELDNKTQSQYIGWQGAFFNLAKVLANSGLVFVAGVLKDSIGVVNAWMIIMGICAALMVVASLYHMRMLPTGSITAIEHPTAKDTWNTLLEVLKSFFLKKYIWIYFVFIVLYRFAEGFAIKIVPLFLQAPLEKGGLGLNLQQIGVIYGVATVTYILGSISAGYYIAAKGLKNTLFKLALVFNIPFAVYFFLAVYMPSNIYVIAGALILEYFAYGFGFVGLTLFMMQQVAPGKHQMAHYAFCTSIMTLGVLIPGMISGWISDTWGYKLFFTVVILATIPALLAAFFVPFTHPDGKNEEAVPLEE